MIAGLTFFNKSLNVARGYKDCRPICSFCNVTRQAQSCCIDLFAVFLSEKEPSYLRKICHFCLEAQKSSLDLSIPISYSVSFNPKAEKSTNHSHPWYHLLLAIIIVISADILKISAENYDTAMQDFPCPAQAYTYLSVPSFHSSSSSQRLVQRFFFLSK